MCTATARWNGASSRAAIQSRRAPTGSAATSAFVPRFGPRIERTLRQALPGVGHDERFVVLQDGAEAIAPGARAPRVVEREQDRGERGSCRAAIGARGMGGEAAAVAIVQC